MHPERVRNKKVAKANTFIPLRLFKELKIFALMIGHHSSMSTSIPNIINENEMIFFFVVFDIICLTLFFPIVLTSNTNA